MKIIVEKTGIALTGDELLSATVRYDLVPVPVTLEFKMLGSETAKSLDIGDGLMILDNETPLTIIKKQVEETDLMQGERLLSIVSFVAVLTSCENLIQASNRAILLDATSMASAYRACGVNIAFNKDVPLVEFEVFFGKTPSFEIARRCCEEACVICYKNNRLNAVRLSELALAEPKAQINPNMVQYHNNDALQEVLNTQYISINADGSTIEDSLHGAKTTNFYPNMDTRRLKNLRTVLVLKATLMRHLSPQFVAGDTFAINGENYVILTAAHHFATGALGGEPSAFSKFWLSQIVE